MPVSPPNEPAAPIALGDRVPSVPDGEQWTVAAHSDAAFDAFYEWTIDVGLALYPAQEQAVLDVMAGHHVILATPTGSGKSLVALAQHFRALCLGERSFYTSPIKALVSEKFFALCRDLGADNVGMLTGDASINRDAPIVCCTAEVLANIALVQGHDAPVQHVVMDEFHYYADRDRGMAWQVPLIALPHATFLLMSATLGDVSDIRISLQKRTGRTVSVVTSEQRPVPLEFTWSDDPIHDAVAELLRLDRAPIYLVNSTQREAAEQAQNLMSIAIIDKPQRRAIAEAIGDFRFDSPYGQVVQRFVRHGVGLHHAGLLPKYRLLVERLAQAGLLRVISGTDTLGVGINVPLRTVLLTQLCKYDGERVRLLSVREFKQIAGRAGRKGFDDQGWVVGQAPAHVIENRRLAAKAAMGGGKARFVRRKPPEHGFVPWNEATFDKLVTGAPEQLDPVFRIDLGTMMTMLHHGDGPTEGLRRLIGLIGHSHLRPAAQLEWRRQVAQLFRSLRSADIVQLWPRQGRVGRDVELAEGLQRNFSLHHSLSLYLVEALELLDSDVEDRALRIVGLVEAILENPRQVLRAQVRREKGLIIARLKAEGVPYDERMEKLEGITWPKPDADWIYETFNTFAEHHPWIGAENIRPKAIVRELVDRFCSFDDYVRELGLERSEGVLLRYISQVYKTLLQNVPDDHKDPELLDFIAVLRVLLARVDSSLLQHWEELRGGASGATDGLDDAERQRQAARVDLAKDQAALFARIRVELHTLVRALARGEWQQAADAVRQDGEHGWSAERFEAELAAFSQERGAVLFDHSARLRDKTAIHADGPRRWVANQVLVDQEQTGDGFVRVEVDLGADVADLDGPLIAVLAIGW